MLAPPGAGTPHGEKYMTYSGAETAKTSRESLGKALEALQQDSNIPDDVMAVAQNIAQSVGALFEAQNATSEPDGKACVKKAIGGLGQTLALLQDVRSTHAGIESATEAIAEVMGKLYPLTTAPSVRPPAPDTIRDEPEPEAKPKSKKKGKGKGKKNKEKAPEAKSSKADSSIARQAVEANIGANTESNFYVGFSGEVCDGGVFVSTYEILKQGTPIDLHVTLPGNFEFHTKGHVRFVRDPFDLNSDSEPGMGVQFEDLDKASRELVLRFIRKRTPMFYED